MIGIVDYGAGNVRSIRNMLLKSGIASEVTADHALLRKADRLILPGVGHFGYAMDELKKRDLIGILNERALEAKVPVLGICLGGQLVGRHSQEGDAEGLGWIDMDVVAFDRSRLGPADRVPHMGWTDTPHRGHPLFVGEDDPRFYYVHSFHMVCDDPADIICEAEHGYRFTSGVARGNIMGLQFHPEKSHVHGRAVLKNFAGLAG